MPFKKLKSLGRAIAAGVLFWGAVLGPVAPVFADQGDLWSIGQGAGYSTDAVHFTSGRNFKVDNNLSVGGTLTVTGNSTQTGNTVQTGNETVTGNSTNGAPVTGSYAVPATATPAALTVKGTFVIGPRVALGLSGPTGLASTNTFPVNGSFETIISTGLALLMTATPAISTNTLVGGTTVIADGMILVIASSATQVITFQSNGTLSGSLLKLGAATRAVTQFKRLTLQFDAVDGFWEEIAYSSDAN